VSTKKSWVLGSLLVGGLSLAATAPVAMRVEVEPRRQVGASTEVAVVVQVSPEDRVRIGSNAILRIELDGGRVSSGSPMRAVRLEDDGSTRVVVEWPPGEHHLRVEIEDPNREDTGLWVGIVRIPNLSPGSVAQVVQEPESEPASAPASDPTEPETEPEIDAKDTVDVPEEAVVAPVPVEPPVPEPVSEPAPEVDEPGNTEAVAQTTPEPPVSDAAAMAGSAAVGAAAMPEISEPVTEEKSVEIEQTEPEPLVVAENAPEEPPIEKTAPPIDEPEKDEVIPDEEWDLATIEDETEPPLIEEPTEVAEEPPLIEPLRADPPPQTAEPEATAPRQQAEPNPAMVPVSAELAVRYEEWGSADPDTREFSVVMLRGREPAKNIDVTGLRLRVGGSEVPVERLGDVESAPLLLGLAIDVAADEIDGWSGMQGSLAPIVERAGNGRGQLFVANPSGVGDWDAESASPDRTVDSRVPMNVSQLVIASLERFEDRRGRTFLVVLTDGRTEPSKEEWQQANDSAGAAGVPILVVALWDDDFNNRTRKNLKKLTEVSGGSLFLVQGRAQLESAADRFGRYLDGGYSIRFKLPGGDRQTLTTISVSASDKELDVSAPKTIR
jgi:hypothetical protein